MGSSNNKRFPFCSESFNKESLTFSPPESFETGFKTSSPTKRKLAALLLKYSSV